MKVLWKIDNLRGAWNEATIVGQGTSVTWEITTPPQLLGEHLLFVVAMDSTASSLSSSSTSTLMRLSDVAAYEFTCLSPPPEAPGIVDSQDPRQGGKLAWTPTGGEQGWYELEVSDDPDFSDVVMRVSGIRTPGHIFNPAQILEGTGYWRVAAVDYPHGKRSAFSAAFPLGTQFEGAADLPAPVTSLHAYPNPSPAEVVIKLMVPGMEEADCRIYDVAGREIAALPMIPGADGLAAEWNARDDRGTSLPPGVYYARIQAPGLDLRRKIVLIR
jgi:hypothetical protein